MAGTKRKASAARRIAEWKQIKAGWRRRIETGKVGKRLLVVPVERREELIRFICESRSADPDDIQTLREGLLAEWRRTEHGPSAAELEAMTMVELLAAAKAAIEQS